MNPGPDERSTTVVAVAPKGAVMSGRQLAKGKDFVFAERGEVSLKGFEEPVRLYEMRWREKD